MADFVYATFQASVAVGGPHRLARRLGVEPDQLFRWIAGRDLPPEAIRRSLEQRMRDARALLPLSGTRRHGDEPEYPPASS